MTTKFNAINELTLLYQLSMAQHPKLFCQLSKLLFAFFKLINVITMKHGSERTLVA